MDGFLTHTACAAAQPLRHAAGEVPDWVHLFPAGHVVPYDADARVEDEKPGWVLTDPEAVIASSFSGPKRIHIDINHSTETMGKLGADAPAHGYIVEMQAREDGLWGKVDWNPSGRALMQNRSYWGLSPVFDYDRETRAVLRIKSAALTNDPALRALRAVAAATPSQPYQPETGMELPKKLADALGLGEDASVDDAVAAIKKMKKAGDGQASMTAVAGAMGLSEDASQTELVAAAGALKASSDKITELTAQLTALQERDSKRAAEAWLAAKRAEGVGIPVGADAHWLALYADSPERAEALCASLPKLGAAPVPKTPAGEAQAALTAEQMQAARAMGLSDTEMAEALEAERKAREAS